MTVKQLWYYTIDQTRPIVGTTGIMLLVDLLGTEMASFTLHRSLTFCYPPLNLACKVAILALDRYLQAGNEGVGIELS
jgi:hypothetical protein